MEVHEHIPAVFEPLLKPARYLGAWGGRGSGKSHFFAWKVVKRCLVNPGSRIVCIREVQKTLKDSSKRLIEDKLQKHRLGLAQGFECLYDSIRTPGDGIISFIGMQNANAENVKSLEGYDVAWVEEAQTLTETSLSLLRPTIRKENSELWFSWNARRKTDAVDKLLRGPEIPHNAIIVQANWKDNPFFPAVLEQERQDCLRLQPEQYEHIWEGDYLRVLEGAYYAESIAIAKQEKRIGGKVPADPLLTVKIACDIGGTGAKADNFVFIAFQNVGKEIRVLNHYEVQGQPLAAHLNWLRSQRYLPDNTQIFLPHDGSTQDKVLDISYESALIDAGYNVTVIPNQGKGAAMARIEAGRRMFPSMWFDIDKTEMLIEALGYYHEKQDEVRSVGLGPNHDWASHSSDAFGLLALVSNSAINNIPWKHQKAIHSRGGWT